MAARKSQRPAKKKTKKKVSKKTAESQYKEDPLEAFNPEENLKKLMKNSANQLQDLTNAYRLDWVTRYSTLTPMTYLQKFRGLSRKKAESILKHSPAQEWYDQKKHYLNQISENVAKRHIDAIAEVQDQYVKASQLGLAKCLEMLSKINTEPLLDSKGVELKTKSGKPVHRPRSLDVLNLMNAIKTGQEIYRKAMGIREEEGLQSIINVIQTDQINVQNNTTVNTTNVVEKVKDELTYDEIMIFVEEKRRALALPSAEENIEVKKDGSDS